MRIGELILIGLGLSMDAAAVAIADTLAYPGLTRKNRLAIPAAFALFQALMPVAGYLAGNLFAGLLSRYTGPVSLAVLGAIGLNMVREGLAAPEGPSASGAAEPPKAALKGEPPASAPAGPHPAPGAGQPQATAAAATPPARQLKLPVLLAQALATSIDALAVGVLFAARPGGILPAAAIIGLTTLLCSFAALQLGRRFGALLGRRAQVLGGLILIALGVKALF